MLFPSFVTPSINGTLPSITSAIADGDIQPLTCADPWQLFVQWALADYDNTAYRLDVEYSEDAVPITWAPLWSDCGNLTDDTDVTLQYGDGGGSGDTAYRTYRLTISRRSDSAVIDVMDSNTASVLYDACP